MDSTSDLNFSDYAGGKVVGTHTYVSYGNGLKNKEATEIVIPETYLGLKVIEIGCQSFRTTNIESVFVSRYVKSIQLAAFYNCTSLKYITFDSNSELEYLGYALIHNAQLESINLPASLKSISTINSIFYYTPTLNCASYFGSNDISFSGLFGTSTI